MGRKGRREGRLQRGGRRRGEEREEEGRKEKIGNTLIHEDKVNCRRIK